MAAVAEQRPTVGGETGHAGLVHGAHGATRTLSVLAAGAGGSFASDGSDEGYGVEDVEAALRCVEVAEGHRGGREVPEGDVEAVLRAVGLDASLWYDEVLTLVRYVRLPLGELVAFGDEAHHEILRETEAVRDRAMDAITQFLDRVAPPEQ